MSQQAFDDVLRRARQLPPREQKLLVEQLTRSAPEATGKEGNGEGSSQESSEPRTVGQALRELGFIGSLKDAPPDLGTNPKYMEGFGEHND